MNIVPLTMPDGRPIPNHILIHKGVTKPVGIPEVVIEILEVSPMVSPVEISPISPEKTAWILLKDPNVTSTGFIKGMENVKPYFWLEKKILKTIVEKYDLDVYTILNKLGHQKHHTLLASDIYSLLHLKHSRKKQRFIMGTVPIIIIVYIISVVIAAIYG